MTSNHESVWHSNCKNQAASKWWQPSLNNLMPEDWEEALCRATAELEGYRSLYENTPLIYFVLDQSGTIRSINHYGASRLGYTVAELVNQPIFAAFHPDDRPALEAAFLDCVQQGQPTLPQWEFRQLCRDGRALWVKIGIRLLHSADTAPIALFVCEDITEQRQQAERERMVAALTKLSAGIAQRIRQSLQLDEVLNTTVTEVRQFLKTDRVFIYRFQPDWSGVVEVESVGEAWQPILGMRIKDTFFDSLSGRELYKRGRVQALEDVNTAGLSPCHADLLRRLQVRANLVVPILQQTTTPEPASERLWGLLVAQHCAASRQWQPLETDLLCQLATQVGIAIQQAELYQQVQQLNADLEQQVQERTAQLQQALDFEARLKRITDSVRDTLDESQILQAAVRELSLGLGVDSCDTALYDLDEGITTVRYEHTKLGIPIAVGQVLRLSDDSEIYAQLLQGLCFQFCKLRPRRGWLSVLVCPIFDDKGTLGDLWLFRSRSKTFDELEIRLVQQVANQCAIAIRQARLHEAAHLQLRELEKLSQLKDDFLGTVSHELRSPVCNMKMAIQMLEVASRQSEASEQPNGQHRFSRYLQILNNECDREINLVNDLLDLQRLESQLQPFSPGAIELPLWLAKLSKPFQERAQHRHQVLRLHLSANLPILISDPSHLERILSELLNNACKYTPPGEQIALTAEATGSMIHIKVCNSGVEIPLSEQSRIFDKFYRINHTDRWWQGGTGLGLALVKKLTELIGGRVWVESHAAQTCFTVELPAKSPARVGA